MRKIHRSASIRLEDAATARPKAQDAYRRLTFHMTHTAPKPELTAAQEHDLLSRAKVGDKSASHELFQHFESFLDRTVERVAKESACPELVDDMHSAATSGFFKAISLVELDRDTRFSIYLSFRIVGDLRSYALRNSKPLAYGRGSDERKAFYSRHKIQNKFSKAFGRAPSDLAEDIDWMAKELGVAPKAMRRAIQVDQIEAVPAERVNIADPGPSLDDLAQRASGNEALQQAFAAVRKTLSRRDYDILTVMSRHDVPNSFMADEYDISPERVGQIFRKAVSQLRSELASRGIESRADLA